MVIPQVTKILEASVICNQAKKCEQTLLYTVSSHLLQSILTNVYNWCKLQINLLKNQIQLPRSNYFCPSPWNKQINATADHPELSSRLFQLFSIKNNGVNNTSLVSPDHGLHPMTIECNHHKLLKTLNSQLCL